MINFRTKFLRTVFAGWLILFASFIGAVSSVYSADDSCEQASMNCCTMIHATGDAIDSVSDKHMIHTCDNSLCYSGCTVAVPPMGLEANEGHGSEGPPRQLTATLVGVAIAPEYQPPRFLRIS